MHPFLEHDGPIPMVHRGAPLGHEGEVVENTRAAFRRAHQLGFRYFETDVRTTRDGVLVACHDHTLRRVAGERVRIADVTWDELADTPVGDEPLPRLVDLLEEYSDVSFNIDPKVDAAVRPLATVLLDMGVLSRACVASFSDRRLWWVRTALRGQVCTAAGPRELTKASAQAARGQPLSLPGVDVLQVPRWLTRRSPAPLRWPGPRQGPRQGQWRADLVAAAQRVGLPVHVWTVNDGAEMERLLGRGVDGVMSDDTEVLASVFTAHGWQPRQ